MRYSFSKSSLILIIALCGTLFVLISCQKSGTGVDDTFTIRATAGDNGEIEPSGEIKVKYGDSQQFTISPDPGYKIDKVTVDGSSVGQVTEYLFTKVVENHTINADFVEKTASDLIAEGWQAFSVRDYNLAAYCFASALARDSTAVEAYSGAGWSNARLNNLSSAAQNFSAGMKRSSSNLDLKAGLAFVLNAQKLYAQSDTLALNVIESKVNWVFIRDSSISISDLRLLLAENYFAESNYELSLQQVKILNPSFAVTDVSVVSGQTALAQEIERLRAIV